MPCMKSTCLRKDFWGCGNSAKTPLPLLGLLIPPGARLQGIAIQKGQVQAGIDERGKRGWINMKVCGKCKIEKPYTDFTRDFNYKDGFNCWCKLCHCEYWRAYDSDMACRILRRHSFMMQSDPDHLTTEFMQKIIGRKCD
jgi:hypothetical protein